MPRCSTTPTPTPLPIPRCQSHSPKISSRNTGSTLRGSDGGPPRPSMLLPLGPMPALGVQLSSSPAWSDDVNEAAPRLSVDAHCAICSGSAWYHRLRSGSFAGVK